MHRTIYNEMLVHDPVMEYFSSGGGDERKEPMDILMWAAAMDTSFLKC